MKQNAMSTPEFQADAAQEKPRYVLMTAAHNEVRFIEKLLKSVLAQSILPCLWVIVSDNSSDGTDELVAKYAHQHAFIRLIRVKRSPGRNFGAKGIALQRGADLLRNIDFQYIGNIDADISVDPLYFEGLIRHFEYDSALGIAAGWICELKGGEFHSRKSNRSYAVPHAAQLMRRECYQSIGGYAVFKYGGEDWHAQKCAEMLGWRAAAFPSLRVFHHRPTGGATNLLRDRFRLGRLDHSFGSDPGFEIFKCVNRLSEKPVLIGAMFRLAGFFWSYVCREPRPVSDEFVAFLRSEQRVKLLSFVRSVGRRRWQLP